MHQYARSAKTGTVGTELFAAGTVVRPAAAGVLVTQRGGAWVRVSVRQARRRRWKPRDR